MGGMSSPLSTSNPLVYRLFNSIYGQMLLHLWLVDLLQIKENFKLLQMDGMSSPLSTSNPLVYRLFNSIYGQMLLHLWLVDLLHLRLKVKAFIQATVSAYK